MPDGTEIKEIVLSAFGLEINVITWGAVIRDLRVSIGEVHNRHVVLGLNNLEDYLNHSPHFGAIAGRCANRIAGGRFVLEGQPYQLTKNQTETHHLHGGALGFGKRRWTIVDHSASHVTLQIISEDGDEGYPGCVTAQCTYRITNTAQLEINLTAETTAPTLVNLAHHSYFNLDESEDIKSHRLSIAAETYLPTDASFIPTGEIIPLAGTVYDFRKPREIHPLSDGDPTIYDNNFNISKTRTTSPVTVANLYGKRDLMMEVASTEPGLQFYDGKKIDVPVKGLRGQHYGPYAGLCLEPQVWPDSPNHPQFPSTIIRPEQSYRQLTRYRFKETGGDSVCSRPYHD